MIPPVRELVLTGLPEFWPEQEDHALFFGPWCFAHHPKHAFQEYVNFQTIPSPWRSSDDLLEASRKMDALYDRILPAFADLMNRLHNVDHSDHFWRIISVSWLVHFLGMCHDRYQRLSRIRDVHSDKPLPVKILSKGTWVAKDGPDFFSNLGEHALNLQLISDIIRESRAFDFLNPKECSLSTDPLRCPLQTPLARQKTFQDRLHGLPRRLLQVAFSFLRSRAKPQCVFGHVNGISDLDWLRMQLALDPFFFARGIRISRPPSPVPQKRNRLLSLAFAFDAQNDFEHVVQKILPAQMPEAFLSYYPRQDAQRSCTRVWIGNDIYGPLEATYPLAHVVEQGGKWINTQHGAGYGQKYAFPQGKIDYETAGTFITWGWTHPHNYAASYHALPSPALSRIAHTHADGAGILFIGTANPSYQYRFQNSLQPENFVDYLNWKIRFIAHLETQLVKQLHYRPYYLHDYGIDEIFMIRKAHPSCRIQTSGTATDRLRHTRLFVSDHLGTSFLEALAIGVPTLLFWHPKVYQTAPFANTFFQELRNAGILFDSPEEAAQKTNEIWDDVEGWWQQKKVCAARTRFQKEYALTDKDWRRKWIDFLKIQLCENASPSMPSQ